MGWRVQTWVYLRKHVHDGDCITRERKQQKAGMSINGGALVKRNKGEYNEKKRKKSKKEKERKKERKEASNY